MTNAERLHQVERGLAGVDPEDEHERAWWQQRVDFMRELTKREGPEAESLIGPDWRARLAQWRREAA